MSLSIVYKEETQPSTISQPKEIKMDKAGKSQYYEIVTLQNRHYREATEKSYAKAKHLAENMIFQRGLEEETLGNVDNGISVFQGINYKKLPHYINWNLGQNSQKPIPLKAV